MLKVRLIPCLDVADGRVVKGVNFVELRDAGDPVEAARAYDAAGADELCFLDIHATHENRGTMIDLVTRTAETCFMPLTVGGGVRTPDDVRALLLAGADKVSLQLGRRRRPRRRGRAAPTASARSASSSPSTPRPWRPAAGRSSPTAAGAPTGIDAVAFARTVAARGAGEILLTSMDRDGTRAGFNLPLTRAVADAVRHPGDRVAAGSARSTTSSRA